MCHNTQYNDAYVASTGTYDFSYVFNDIKDYISSADLAIGNLETTFAGKARGYSSYPTFNTPEELAENLKDLGIDVVSTANNHCMDKGYKGIVSTLDYLDQAGILHTGTSRSAQEQETVLVKEVMIKDISGTKIALTMKLDSNNPWKNASEKYEKGQVVTGKVARMTDFGAFVELEEGIDALLHVSQISIDHVEKPSDVLSVGQEVTAKIVDFNEEAKKISLSIKALEIEKQNEDAAEEDAE